MLPIGCKIDQNRMTKRFHFNPETLQYEQRVVSPLKRFLRVSLFFLLCAVVGVGSMFFYTSLVDTPRAQVLSRTGTDLRTQINMLKTQVASSTRQLARIEQRDNFLYRTIFEADSIPSSVRQGGTGGSVRYPQLSALDGGEELRELALEVDALSWRAYIQSRSFDEVMKLAHDKERLMHCIPAIQPVSVRQLVRMSSTFGYRSDPLTHHGKFHSGVDFTGAHGTPIHSSGDGIVVTAAYSSSGYGNQVIIDHGFGYKTRYAHMSKIEVREGERVKRGQVVGAMGSSGRSTGTHLHYEVLVKNQPVNPLHYFNDMDENEYEVMLAHAESKDLD